MHTIQRSRAARRACRGRPHRASGATDPRAAAEEVLRDGDGPVELTFDVVRVGGATEPISMILERPDLERTLQSAAGEELALVFDPDELERAIEGSEVEAQGLRETAAVLTVAVAAMAGSAGVASAAARCERHRLCRPGGRYRGDRQRCRRGRCEWHGYVVPAGGTEAIVNDAGVSAGASGTGYVVPAGGTEAIVNDAGVRRVRVVRAMSSRRAAGGDRQRCRRGGCERHGLCRPGGRHGGDRQRCRRGRSASGTGYVAPAAESGAALSSTDAAAIGTGAILLVAGAAFAAARTRRRPDTPDVAPA